jgi:hypothetical protein
VSDINSWWSLDPIRSGDDPGGLDWSENEANLTDYAPGGELWPQAYDQHLELSPAYDLGGLLPGPVKRVVINDYLPAGQLFVTENEVILSKVGWERLIARVKLMNECNVAVRRIVEREMGDVLEWLREAGHDL